VGRPGHDFELLLRPYVRKSLVVHVDHRLVFPADDEPVESKRSFPFHSAYGASKHGIDGYLETLRVELKHEGWPISVTQVMPGTINTPFFEKGRSKLGVKPVGVPPIYEPQTVANIILYAAENPARDLVLGGAAQALIITQRLSPRMLDAILATRAGFSPQKTHEPRSEDDPDNLYAPINGHDTAKNGFRALTEPLQLVGDAPYREARGCGGHGAGAPWCLEGKVAQLIENAPERQRSADGWQSEGHEADVLLALARLRRESRPPGAGREKMPDLREGTSGRIRLCPGQGFVWLGEASLLSLSEPPSSLLLFSGILRHTTRSRSPFAQRLSFTQVFRLIGRQV
jgi:hypothetical protein